MMVMLAASDVAIATLQLQGEIMFQKAQSYMSMVFGPVFYILQVVSC